MDPQTGPAPTTYGAPPPRAHPDQVAAAYAIAARVVVVLSALGLVGVVALTVFAATDPGEYSGFGYLFALFLLVPVLVALALLGAAQWCRHRTPVLSLALACVAAAGMALLAVNVFFFIVPV